MRSLKMVLLPLAILPALAACQTTSSKPAPVGTSAMRVMERVTLGANACWFKTKDPAFAAYRMSPELDSYSGKPRFLLVAKNHPESLPALVVMAEGDPAQMQAFGPLMQGPLNSKISNGVNHWAKGNTGCPA